MRLAGETEKLEVVRRIAHDIGYGNCIQYLRHAWAMFLHKKHGLDLYSAALGAGMDKTEAKAFKKGFNVLKEAK